MEYMNMDTLFCGWEIMVQGMVGIFLTCLIIMGSTWCLKWILDARYKKNEK